jgi:hypothetical protein
MEREGGGGPLLPNVPSPTPAVCAVGAFLPGKKEERNVRREGRKEGRKGSKEEQQTSMKVGRQGKKRNDGK